MTFGISAPTAPGHTTTKQNKKRRGERDEKQSQSLKKIEPVRS